MNIKPKNAIVGPMTILRVENMSGLKDSVVLLPPSIRRKPIRIMAPEMAIKMKLVLTKGNCSGVWRSISSIVGDGFADNGLLDICVII